MRSKRWLSIYQPSRSFPDSSIYPQGFTGLKRLARRPLVMGFASVPRGRLPLRRVHRLRPFWLWPFLSEDISPCRRPNETLWLYSAQALMAQALFGREM